MKHFHCKKKKNLLFWSFVVIYSFHLYMPSSPPNYLASHALSSFFLLVLSLSLGLPSSGGPRDYNGRTRWLIQRLLSVFLFLLIHEEDMSYHNFRIFLWFNSSHLNWDSKLKLQSSVSLWILGTKVDTDFDFPLSAFIMCYISYVCSQFRWLQISVTHYHSQKYKIPALFYLHLFCCFGSWVDNESVSIYSKESQWSLRLLFICAFCFDRMCSRK